MKEDIVAFDTEADSFYHYFDKVCLVQVATRDQCWLIDPLGIGGPDKLAPLAPVFSSPKTRVLFHAAEYDIYVLKRDCGFEFTNLFDTMVSAEATGYPAIGLAALIEKHFGVSLPKDEQRSDWSCRPRPKSRPSYAASDVLYLIKLAETLEKEPGQGETPSTGRWTSSRPLRASLARTVNSTSSATSGSRAREARRRSSRSSASSTSCAIFARATSIARPSRSSGIEPQPEISRSQPTDLDSLSEIKGISDLILKRAGKDLVSSVKKGCASCMVRSRSSRPAAGGWTERPRSGSPP